MQCFLVAIGFSIKNYLTGKNNGWKIKLRNKREQYIMCKHTFKSITHNYMRHNKIWIAFD